MSENLYPRDVGGGCVDCGGGLVAGEVMGVKNVTCMNCGSIRYKAGGRGDPSWVLSPVRARVIRQEPKGRIPIGPIGKRIQAARDANEREQLARETAYFARKRGKR